MVDKRSDIWAFGCVLYEMLSGRLAFQGATVSDTIVDVLEREPDWQALPPSTPAPVRDLVRRCLQKEANRRLRDIGDARIELDEVLKAWDSTGEPSGTPPLLPLPRGRRRAIAVVAAAGLGLAGAAAVLWRIESRRDGTAPAAPTHTQVTFSGTVREAAISPDGRSIAYVSEEGDTRRLMIRDLSGGPPLEVSRGAVSSPRWSPDGSRLAYAAAGIFVVSRYGGEARFTAGASSPGKAEWAAGKGHCRVCDHTDAARRTGFEGLWRSKTVCRADQGSASRDSRHVGVGAAAVRGWARHAPHGIPAGPRPARLSCRGRRE
jgi:hypothetical protein